MMTSPYTHECARCGYREGSFSAKLQPCPKCGSGMTLV